MDHTDGKSRQQRRAEARAERLIRDAPKASPELDAVMADDRAFFERTPGRSYRVRRAAPCEMRDIMACGGLPDEPFDGVVFAFVHQVRPGTRCRQFAAMAADTPTDAGEEHARALWEQCAHQSGQVDRITKAMRMMKP